MSASAHASPGPSSGAGVVDGRIGFVLHASEILASTLDPEATLSNLADLAVSQFADGCIVSLVSHAGQFRVVAIALKASESYPAGEPKLSSFPQLRADGGHIDLAAPHGASVHEPRLFPVVTRKILKGLVNSETELNQMLSLRLHSLMLVPLVARERLVGVLSLFTTAASGRYYGTGDLAVAEDLGRRAALAIDNARLYSERKTAEHALRTLTQEMQAVIRSSPLAIVHMDVDGKIVDWNPAAERVTGWNKEEVVGKYNPMFPDHPECPGDQYMARLRKGETLDGVVLRRRRRDGSLVDLSKWASPLTDPDGNVSGFMAIYMDITERVRFLKIAAHELGNPLSSILAGISLMKLYVDGDAPKERTLNQLEQLKQEATHVSTLLDEIITAFRSHEGTLSVEPAYVDMRDVVRTAVEARTEFASRAQLNMDDEPSLVWGDAKRLEQAVVNLLDNACKYSPAGSRVQVSVRATEHEVWVTIEDQGVGIAQSEVARVFDEFYRTPPQLDLQTGRMVEAYAPSDMERPGLGLGLFISKEIVLQHDGRIWARSVPGQGTTMYTVLPRVPAGSVRGSGASS